MTHHRPHSETRLAFEGLGRRTALWVAFWTAVWVIQWALFPTWLIGSRSGLGDVLLALPGGLVALLALVLASLFLLASHTVSLYGSRSVLIVLLDKRLVEYFLHPLILVTAALLIDGQLPDDGTPQHWVTSAAATLVIATVWLLWQTSAGLVLAFSRITAPRNFASHVASEAVRLLRGGAFGLVGYRIPLLGEMIRNALRRGESVPITAALEAILTIEKAYLDEVAAQPQASSERTESAYDSSLADDLYYALVRAADEALKLGAAEEDMDAIARAFELVTLAAIESGREIEGGRLIDGLARAGLTIHQVSGSTVNLWPYSAVSLARAERAAETSGLRDVAASAIANWALIIAYTGTHFGVEHPQLELSKAAFGGSPDWDEGINVTKSPDWQLKWRNKIEADPRFFEVIIDYAAGRGPHPTSVQPPSPKTTENASPA